MNKSFESNPLCCNVVSGVTVQFSSVILKPHFEAARGLFGDRPRHFELWLDDEVTTLELAHIYGGYSVELGIEPGTSGPEDNSLPLTSRVTDIHVGAEMFPFKRQIRAELSSEPTS
ncbi:hypothetical protein AVEN_9964-1 [Araneus ventricosus]|uniref:Uncharacterized protein n=1 Tax=Araneus ventricosus TaxID=182803 RepID=A0A4Y2FAL6_ARAVE|nr:hypothetical protein AVEN_9964-1 [Araneus ventricosus]